jgi:hypothetical protein
LNRRPTPYHGVALPLSYNGTSKVCFGFRIYFYNCSGLCNPSPLSEKSTDFSEIKQNLSILLLSEQLRKGAGNNISEA